MSPCPIPQTRALPSRENATAHTAPSARKEATSCPACVFHNRTVPSSLPDASVFPSGENATWKNTIGDPELISVWTDPDFDPKQPAFYYARVIEIPTPRWTAYDRVRLDAPVDDAVRLKTQERAYTSPIWYSP